MQILCVLAIIRRYKYSTQSDMISGVTLFVSKRKQRRFSPRESSRNSFTVHSFTRAVRHNARQTGQNVTWTQYRNPAPPYLLSAFTVNGDTDCSKPGEQLHLQSESRYHCRIEVCTSLFRKSERVTVHITLFTHAINISGIYLITRLPGINMSLKCCLLFNDSMYTFMHLADALIQSDVRCI